jgi:formylglycine-generating enzyme required for sulfatase activity
MVMIPAGSAVIGDITGDGAPDERPAHKVTISAGLAVGRYEVTFEEWDACVADGGCATTPSDEGWGRGRRPVINVNLGDAKQYAAWLSRKTGKPYRLLSEAEWEYAARAGATTRYAFGDDATQLCAYGNHADNSTDYPWRNRGCSDGYAKQTAPVGAFKSNANGLSDMQGNVWEWVEDCWHDTYDGAPINGRAWTSACSRPGGVLRGGAWSVRSENLSAAYRYFFDANVRTPYFGFRVVRDAP